MATQSVGSTASGSKPNRFESNLENRVLCFSRGISQEGNADGNLTGLATEGVEF